MHRIGDSLVRPTQPTIACALATWEALNLRCPVLGASGNLRDVASGDKAAADELCANCVDPVCGSGPAPVRRLHLLRHAKSSWDDASLPDHDRPLSPRGIRAAEQMRRWLDDNDVRPGIALCSTAVRTRETLEHVLPALGGPRVIVEAGLYHASAESLLEHVYALPDETGEAMFVGHNPGLERLVRLLAEPSALHDTMEKFPTGALATLESAGRTWRELQPGSMTLTGLVLPRTLGSRQDP
jgi:phosphohistidine phosphatase